MSEIQIETLTPVHIGSGRDLTANTEYVPMQVTVDGENETHLVVLNEAKVLDVIGQENINIWVNKINNNENLLPYLRERKPDLVPEDIGNRSVIFFGENAKRSKTLKEHKFDGRQVSYIPGSSVKGAIRTAVLAHYARNNPEFAGKNMKGKKGFSGESLEQKLFGKTPNESVFRFLQVGDAYFEYKTIALSAEILNRFRQDWDFKKGGSQLLEAIPDGADTTFSLKSNTGLLKKMHSDYQAEFLDIKTLFHIINAHTITLLEKELQRFEDQESKQDAFNAYTDVIETVLDTARNCSENEAVLRIGYGSGWDFITGGWAADVMSDREYEDFLNTVRKQSKYDDEVPFPKTRTMSDEGDMFGFVKLTQNT